MSGTLSRRDLLLRGALGAAALSLPAPDVLAAVRRRQPRRSVHCLAPADRFKPGLILEQCSFASFAPDGERVALVTPRGIEILNRADGSRVAVTGPGFTLGPDAWHPDGSVLLASGPAADGSGPFLHSIGANGVVRLLPDYPGQARAASFSPDGHKVAFTYLNRYVHQVCMGHWTGTDLVAPRNLLPTDPTTSFSVPRVMWALSWHETRGFSADGQRLYFASDREGGMLNVSVHYIDLATGKPHRVTFDEGVAEGAVLSPDGAVLYSATTRAREPAFLTMVSGPAVPPFLGFAAEPTLHEQLSSKQLAVVGNGDVIATDPTYGLHGRMVGNRKKLAKKLNAPVPGGTYRVIACSMSADGTQLGVAMISSIGSNVVVLQRKPESLPPPVPVRATPRRPKGAVPLSTQPVPDMSRTLDSRYGGRVQLQMTGELGSGDFRIGFDNFSADGVFYYGGDAVFQTGGGGFRHVSDVRRVNLSSQEDVRVFYSADMQVDWDGGDGQRATGGSIASLSRSGDVAAAWDGTTFAPQEGWTAGNRGPRPVPGSGRCRTVRHR